jgi:predicted nucleic acid-binding protein
MRKTKLYLDTSVPSFLFAEDSPEKKQTTIKFWELLRLEVYEVVISDILLIEINRAKPPLNNQLVECITQLSLFIVHITEDINSLAEKYVQEKIIPKKYFDDALHLACATYANVDAVVSWNFKHFVNLKTIRGVNGVNRIMGLKEIEILTPQSWIEVG